MSTPTLREIIQPDVRGNLAKFARSMNVSWTTAWRWTLPSDHADAIVPPSKWWTRIEGVTGGLWRAPHASFTKRRPRAAMINAAASRKGWATRKRQLGARP